MATKAETTMKVALEKAGIVPPAERLARITDAVLAAGGEARELQAALIQSDDVAAAMALVPDEALARYLNGYLKLRRGHSSRTPDGRHMPPTPANPEHAGRGGRAGAIPDGDHQMRTPPAGGSAQHEFGTADAGQRAVSGGAHVSTTRVAPAGTNGGAAGHQPGIDDQAGSTRRHPGHAKRSGPGMRSPGLNAIALTVADTYRVRGRAIGDFTGAEVCALEQTSFREAYLFRLIRRSVPWHSGLEVMCVREFVPIKTLQRLIQQAAELSDAA